MKTNKLAAAVTAALIMTVSHAGGLQDKLDAHFNAMIGTNLNQGPAYGQLAGDFAGGNMMPTTSGIEKTGIEQPLPSTGAGCAAINLFDDAYEYVNRQDFVDFQQKIANEARGYAFNIALDVACSQCMSWINALQSKVQNINQTNLTNCRLSEGIVTDSPSAFGAKRANDYTLAGAVTGLFDSYYASSAAALDGRDVRSEIDTTYAAKSAEFIGNIVWQELKRNAVTDWVTDPADTEAGEYGILMAFTGTVVIPPSQPDALNAGTGNTNNPRFYPATIGFRDIIEGGALRTYSCDAADTLCVTPAEATVNVTGLADRVHNALDSLIVRMRSEGAAAFTEQELNLLSNMPQPVGAMIKNLSVSSLQTARRMSRDIAYAAAMSMAYDTLSENLEAIETAVMSSTKPEAKFVVDMIRERRRVLSDDYAAYARTHKTMAQVLEQYNDIMKNTQLLAVEIARLGAAGAR